jgi:hypothetical protein
VTGFPRVFSESTVSAEVPVAELVVVVVDVVVVVGVGVVVVVEEEGLNE